MIYKNKYKNSQNCCINLVVKGLRLHRVYDFLGLFSYGSEGADVSGLLCSLVQEAEYKMVEDDLETGQAGDLDS